MGDQIQDGSDADWRLTNQGTYLTGVTLHRRLYFFWSESWEHDHCEFCWRKFLVPGDVAMDFSTNEGWTTDDERRWVCDGCFADFKSRFHWKSRGALATDHAD